MSLVSGVENGTDTEIDAMFCNCNNKCCDGMFLLNKEMWKMAAKGGVNNKNIRPMNVFAISQYVADRKDVRKLLNINNISNSCFKNQAYIIFFAI